MTDTKKVPVSERALIARINRKLAQAAFAAKIDANTVEAKIFKSRPGSMAASNVGKYHVVDVQQNKVIRSNIQDLQAFVEAVGLEVLSPWECSIKSMAVEDLVDSGVTVRLDDLGLDGIDSSTKEGMAALRARLKDIQKDMAFTKELQSRLEERIKQGESAM